MTATDWKSNCSNNSVRNDCAASDGSASGTQDAGRTTAAAECALVESGAARRLTVQLPAFGGALGKPRGELSGSPAPDPPVDPSSEVYEMAFRVLSRAGFRCSPDWPKPDENLALADMPVRMSQMRELDENRSTNRTHRETESGFIPTPANDVGVRLESSDSWSGARGLRKQMLRLHWRMTPAMPIPVRHLVRRRSRAGSRFCGMSVPRKLQHECAAKKTTNTNQTTVGVKYETPKSPTRETGATDRSMRLQLWRSR
jgi:hypothetical protein